MSQNSSDSSTDNTKNIPKVVGDHADRLMDSLFADIEDLLSGDSNPRAKSSPTIIGPQPVLDSSAERQPAEPTLRASDADFAGESSTVTHQPSQRGSWKKILLGLSLAVIAAGGGLWWLAKERKINFDAVMPSDASKADIQFADYLRRSLAKIDSDTNESPANPATLPNPPSAPVVGSATTPAAPLPGISFTKVIQSRPPTAEFVIDGQVQQLNAGAKIGKSGWTLGPVTGALNNEIIIQRNGESRILKAGQQF